MFVIAVISTAGSFHIRRRRGVFVCPAHFAIFFGLEFFEGFWWIVMNNK